MKYADMLAAGALLVAACAAAPALAQSSRPPMAMQQEGHDHVTRDAGHESMRGDNGMAHGDRDAMRRDHGTMDRRDAMRHVGYDHREGDRRGWHDQRRCRTVRDHHRRVRRCF